MTLSYGAYPFSPDLEAFSDPSAPKQPERTPEEPAAPKQPERTPTKADEIVEAATQTALTVEQAVESCLTEIAVAEERVMGLKAELMDERVKLYEARRREDAAVSRHIRRLRRRRTLSCVANVLTLGLGRCLARRSNVPHGYVQLDGKPE